MNILLISGSPRKNGNTNALLEELTAGILEAGKHSVKTVDVTRMKIAPCLGCDGCKRGEKICVQKDDSQLLMNEMRQADYLVFATRLLVGYDRAAQTCHRPSVCRFQCPQRQTHRSDRHRRRCPRQSPVPSDPGTVPVHGRLCGLYSGLLQIHFPPANPAKSTASPICSGRSGTWANPCKQRISSRSERLY